MPVDARKLKEDALEADAVSGNRVRVTLGRLEVSDSDGRVTERHQGR